MDVHVNRNWNICRLYFNQRRRNCSNASRTFLRKEAASIPLVGLTSYQALSEVIKAKPGDKVLIQAGSVA